MKSFKHFFKESTQTEMETNKNIESTFKKIFVQEGNFKWLDNPIIFDSNSQPQYKIVILAVSDAVVNDVYGSGPSRWWEKVPQIRNKPFFCKAINPLTKQLVKTPSLVDLGSSSYCLAIPDLQHLDNTFEKGKLQESRCRYTRFAVNTAKSLIEYKNNFDKVIEYNNITDGIAYFDATNHVRVQGNTKFVPQLDEYPVSISEEITTDVNAFQNYIFEGSARCNCLVNGQVVFPKEVRGEHLIIGPGIQKSDIKIRNLKKFPKTTSESHSLLIEYNVDSFEGLPSVYNGDITVGSASSLIGLPSTINGLFSVTVLDSFTGGANSTINGVLFMETMIALSKASPFFDLFEDIAYTGKVPSFFDNIPDAKIYNIGPLRGDKNKVIDLLKKHVNKRKRVQQELSKDFDVSALDDFS